MRKLATLLAVLALPVALATHFTGTYVDQQNGVTLVMTMQQDGTIQGSLSGPNGQFQLQGQGNEQGAFGTIQSSQGMLGFQAQLSQDNQMLQLAFFQADQNNQPVQVGGLVMQRSAGAGQPGMGQPGQMPGMTQPGAAQPGMPGAAQPGMPGAGQPTFPTAPPAGFPATQPGMPGANQPTFPTAPPVGAPNTAQPGLGQPATQPSLGGGQGAMPTGDWNGAFVGNGGQLVMVIQGAGQPGTYTGYFEASGQRFQLQASGNPQYVEGVFLVNGQQVPFYAENYEGYVYLVDGSDGTEYILEPMNGGPGAAPGAAPVRSPLGGQ